VLCLGLLVGSGLLLWVVAPAALPPLALYAVWAVAYHVLLRNIEIIELLVAMWLYYARVVVGGAAAGVPLPTWLSLCLIFLALVAVLGARSMQLRGGRTRSVLAAYPREFLAGMLFLSAGMAIVFYALFAVLSVRSLLMIYSILPLLAGIMRYLQLTLAPGTQVGQVLKDRGLLISAAVWLAMVVAIFYF
jgi:4-hydroxybenzoate polyprenyltransferase